MVLPNNVPNAALYLWNTSATPPGWADAAATCSPPRVEINGNILRVDICHLTQVSRLACTAATRKRIHCSCGCSMPCAQFAAFEVQQGTGPTPAAGASSNSVTAVAAGVGAGVAVVIVLVAAVAMYRRRRAHARRSRVSSSMREGLREGSGSLVRILCAARARARPACRS